MATYSLVHGAWHGGWCWDRLRSELEARGQTVFAPDLPCDDPHADFDDYAAAVPPADVVVGHSLGGHTITRVPAQVHVFLCALVPGVDETGSEGDGIVLDFDELGRHTLRDAARCLQYPAGDFARLLRPQMRLTRTAAPPPSSPVYVLCTRDAMVRPAWQRGAAAALGIEPIELDAGHSAMLTHPRELADLLLRETGVV
jgi:Alpha/beta hydrolase family